MLEENYASGQQEELRRQVDCGGSSGFCEHKLDIERAVTLAHLKEESIVCRLLMRLAIFGGRC